MLINGERTIQFVCSPFLVFGQRDLAIWHAGFVGLSKDWSNEACKT